MTAEMIRISVCGIGATDGPQRLKDPEVMIRVNP
jgi:hypothetical protein